MKTEEMNKRGHDFLNKGDYARAIDYFQKALRQEEHPSFRNNLALAYFMSEDDTKSLEALNLNIRPEAPPSPFAHSLAAQIYQRLGQDQAAHRQLDLAIRDFEEGKQSFSGIGRLPDFWSEYTVAILRAAGTLGDHRQVYELYRRWQNDHRHWESIYLGGVAAFNLKRYRQAANCWASRLPTNPLFPYIQRVAIMMDQGKIPPFPLDYAFIIEDQIRSLASQAIESNQPEDFAGLANNSRVRLFYLAMTLDEETSLDVRKQFIHLLVQYGGEWGEQLGRSLLLSPTLPQDLKMSIVDALKEAGVYRVGDPIEMYADGEVRLVIYQQYATSESIADEMAPLFEQAVTLRKNGNSKEALQVLEKPFSEGKFYIPAMLLLAQLNYEISPQQKKTEQILSIIKDIAHKTHDESILLDLVGFYLNIGDAYLARQQLQQINISLIPPEQKHKILNRLAQLEIDRLSEHEVEHYTEDRRSAIEDKNLPLHSTLHQGLKTCPWSGSTPLVRLSI